MNKNIRGGNRVKKSQIVGSLLVASLILNAPMTILAEQATESILTVQEAIKNAKSSSIRLEQNERQEKLQKEQAEYIDLMEGWDAREQKDVDTEYTQKEKKIIEEQIERSINQIFDDIIYTEHSIDTLEKKIKVQEKQILKAEQEKNLGVISQFSLEQVKLEYEQSKQNIQQLEKQLEVKYASLCTMMGSGWTKKYTLEKEKNVFQPFELSGSLDAFALKKAEEDISLWKAKEDSRVANNPIYTYDYLTVVNKKEERAAKADAVRLTQQQLEQEIKDTYAQVNQLESRYVLAEENLKIKEKELLINEIQFKKGAISQLEYDKKIMEVESSRDELDKIVNDHTYFKQLLDKPYLV